MEVRNGQTQSCVDFKSTVWSSHVNARRLKWKFYWKYKLPMIKSTFVWSFLWTLYNIVPETHSRMFISFCVYDKFARTFKQKHIPFQYIRRYWLCDDVRYGVLFKTEIVLFQSRCCTIHYPVHLAIRMSCKFLWIYTDQSLALNLSACFKTHVPLHNKGRSLLVDCEIFRWSFLTRNSQKQHCSHSQSEGVDLTKIFKMCYIDSISRSKCYLAR